MFDFSGMRVKKLHPDAQLPRKDDPGDAGYDLFTVEGGVIPAGGRTAFSIGIATELPYGHYAQVKDRSGLALNGITTLGGVIDNGYRGEWKVILHNTDPLFSYVVEPGDKIAQAVIRRYANPEVHEVDELTETGRGACGFGSTGR